MKRPIYCITLIILMGTIAITSNASTGARRVTLEAVYNDIKVVVDGREVELKDANGKTLEPFIVGGTTYLPLRACVNAITGGTKEIEWDAQNYTVLIGDCKTGKIGLHELKPYSNGNYMVTKDIAFTNRTKKIEPFNRIITYNSNNNITYILSGKYSKISGYYVIADNHSDSTLKIFGDGSILHEQANQKGEKPIYVEVNIIGIDKLVIQTGGGYFYNIELEKLD